MPQLCLTRSPSKLQLLSNKSQKPTTDGCDVNYNVHSASDASCLQTSRSGNESASNSSSGNIPLNMQLGESKLDTLDIDMDIGVEREDTNSSRTVIPVSADGQATATVSAPACISPMQRYAIEEADQVMWTLQTYRNIRNSMWACAYL
jgi:hypothetical protein